MTYEVDSKWAHKSPYVITKFGFGPRQHAITAQLEAYNVAQNKGGIANISYGYHKQNEKQ